MSTKSKKDSQARTSQDVEDEWMRFSPYTTDDAENLAKQGESKQRSFQNVKKISMVGIIALVINLVDVIVLGYSNPIINGITYIIVITTILPPYIIYFEYYDDGKGKKVKKTSQTILILWIAFSFALITSLFSCFPKEHTIVQMNLYQGILIPAAIIIVPLIFYISNSIYSYVSNQRKDVPAEQRYNATLTTWAFIISVVSIILNLINR